MRNREKRRGVLVFPKKGSFTDGICMCAQWQHRLFPHRRPAALPLVTSPVSFSPPSSFVCLALLHLICLFSFTPSHSFPSFPVHLVCRSLSASCTDLSSTIFLSRSLSLSPRHYPFPPSPRALITGRALTLESFKTQGRAAVLILRSRKLIQGHFISADLEYVITPFS